MFLISLQFESFSFSSSFPISLFEWMDVSYFSSSHSSNTIKPTNQPTNSIIELLNHQMVLLLQVQSSDILSMIIWWLNFCIFILFYFEIYRNRKKDKNLFLKPSYLVCMYDVVCVCIYREKDRYIYVQLKLYICLFSFLK